MVKQSYIISVVFVALNLMATLFVLKSSPEPFPVLHEWPFISLMLRPLPIGNSIVFGISMGFLVSSIFYCLVVFFPEKKRNRMIGLNLQRQYREIKEGCIAIFLSVIQKSYPAELPRELINQEAFRDYFNAPYDESQSRWDCVLNGLDEYHLGAVLIELELLRESVQYTLNNVEFSSDNVFVFFHNLSQQIYEYRNMNQDYDDINSLSRFLWQLFTGWSFIDGYKDQDIVQIMIDEIK